MIVNKIRERFKKLIYQLAEIDRVNAATVALHQKTFPQFKNSLVGKKLVVCGAGPTLQKYQPIEGAVHIALNRSFLFDKVDFDFIFVQDWMGIKTVQEDLKNYRPKECIKLFGSSQLVIDREIPESFAIECSALRFNTDAFIYQNGYKSRFVKDIDYMCLGAMPVVGLSVLQFALYMNPAELYIVGNDMSGSHFVDVNKGDARMKKEEQILLNAWEKEHDMLIAKWQEFKKFASIYYPNTKIISVNPVGLKGIFEDIYQ